MTSPRPPAWGPDFPTRAVFVAAVAVTWIALKLVAFWGWVHLPDEYGDTYYYFLTAMENADTTAFSEYPTPVGALLSLPYLLGAQDPESYRWAILVGTTLADAAFAVLLGRLTGPVGVLGWMVLTTVLGQVSLLRFDIFPAVAAAAAILMLARGHSRAAAVLVAVGTALKVWPVILTPLVIGGAQRRLRTLGWFAATGLVLVVASVAVGGWDRLLSPITHQRERGLQIESVAATLPMQAWASGRGYAVEYSAFHAFEVTGPDTAGWLALTDLFAAVAFLGCAVLLVVWLRHGCRRQAIPYLALTGIGAFIASSPAFSPQYLLWIAAPAAVGLGWSLTDPDGPRRGPAALTWIGAVTLCLLTTAIYPVNYAALTTVTDTTARAVALLSARNVALLMFVAWTAALAQMSGRPGAGALRPPRGSAATPAGGRSER
ncbi:MAG: glycosyltransferase 87 family protein [Propioniciclava sp.]